MKSLFAILILLAGAAAATAQDHKHSPGLDARGKKFMGFDQQATAHHFILTKDGGRIEVTAKDPKDAASVKQIREHLQHISHLFAKGDFALPGLIHDTKTVPGVDAMKRQIAALTFTFEEVTSGAHVKIAGGNPEVIAAVHE